MFESDTKITIFAVGALAFILSMAMERNAPRVDLETAVPTASLPALPLTARADGTPAQTNIPARRVTLGHGFEARLLHGYVLEGRVVTRREFRTDPTSAVSPLDLGIVWGDLARPERLADFEFRALPRAVRYTPQAGAVLEDGWEEHVTNNHLIPANQSINDALMAVDVGQTVRLRGYLVVVTGDTIVPWRSSTRRDDATIIGGCEIILVTGVDILEPDAKDV